MIILFFSQNLQKGGRICVDVEVDAVLVVLIVVVTFVAVSVSNLKCLNPYFDKKNGREFNCGKCHACRVNITSQWTLRCLYELDKWKYKGASFITLTYDDEHLPKNFGLNKKDLQKFFKRLRINLVRKYGTHFDDELQKEVPNTSILYRACGEYGDSEKKYVGNNGVALGRPHYHAIVYGLDDLNDEHRQILIDSWNLCDPYMFSKERGRESGMQQVTREDIAYVCGYVQKKLNGELGEQTYGDRLPPFSICSQSLGLDFAKKNFKNLSTFGYATLNGQKIGIPRLFRDKLGIDQAKFIKTKSVQQIEEENQVIFSHFQEHLRSIGLLWLLDDPIKNCSAIERRFYSWCKNWEDKQMQLVQEQYEQLRYIRGKGKF